MIHYASTFDEVEEVMREARIKRFNYMSDKLDALFDSDKKENLKLREEIKNDSSR